MKLDEYKEQYDHAPYPLEDFVNGATTVDDCDELKGAAEKFKEARSAFLKAMRKHDVNQG